MNGFAITVCAPSGAGKTTVCQALLRDSEELMFSVSATTRPKRAKERDGVDYRFVTRDEFQGMIERGELLEWAEVHGELYGTPRSNLEQAEREGKLLLLDIDVQGASQMVDSLPDTVTVFLLPPSFDVLMERLRGRGSEDASRLERRMQTAKAELEELPSFQYVVVNDALEDTVAAIRAIVDAERQRPGRRLGELDKLRRELEDGLSG
jgi:guanylate kinase